MKRGEDENRLEGLVIFLAWFGNSPNSVGVETGIVTGSDRRAVARSDGQECSL